MASLKYDKEITALLVIDPYNDFISDGGKVWDRLKTVAEANDCIPHMLQVLNAARKALQGGRHLRASLEPVSTKVSAQMKTQPNTG